MEFHFTVGDFSDLENRIDFNRNAFQFASRLKLLDKCTQGIVGHAMTDNTAALSPRNFSRLDQTT